VGLLCGGEDGIVEYASKISCKFERSKRHPTLKGAVSALRTLAKDERRYNSNQRRLLNLAAKVLRSIIPVA
jgi:hypothetical protein